MLGQYAFTRFRVLQAGPKRNQNLLFGGEMPGDFVVNQSQRGRALSSRFGRPGLGRV